MASKRESNFINMVVTLFLVAAVAAMALGGVYVVTKAPIALAKKKKLEAAIKAVMPEFDTITTKKVADADGNDSLTFYFASKNNKVLGAAVKTYTMKGFSGRIELMVGFLNNGTINNTAVLSHKETPGLGDKMDIKKSDFSVQFKGKNPANFKLKVTKDKGDVDAITAATIKRKEMNQLKNFTKGFIKENPVFILLLGLCPTLGVTTSAVNGLGMGLATTFVLVMSNLVVSLVKDFIPDKVRIPSFIVIIASFVTIVELTMQAYTPALFDALGLFIPLIVVNCIVLGRAEAFASKNNVVSSIIDGLGMGLGFAFALTLLGGVREILGSGAIFGIKMIEGDLMLVFVLAPGAFIVLGYLIAIINKFKKA